MVTSLLRLAFLWVCLLACCTVQAQPQQNRPLLVSEEKWLPSRAINCIFQDSEGLLWVGTNSGLYEYDGFEARHYATAPDKTNAIFSNTVNGIQEDLRGNLLVGTESGLSFLRKLDRQFTTLSTSIQRYITPAATSKGDLLWSVNQEQFLYRLTPNYTTTPPKPTLFFAQSAAVREAVGPISAMLEVNPETMLLGGPKGVFVLNLRTRVVQPAGIRQPVACLLATGRQLWVGTRENGLLQAHLTGSELVVDHTFHLGQPEQAGYDHIVVLAKGPSDILLVGTPQQLYQRTSPTAGLTPIPEVQALLQENNLLSVCADQAGVLWVGTLRGLFKVRPNPLLVSWLKIRTPDYIPLNNQVDLLTADDAGNLLLATHNDGLFAYEPASQQMQRLPYLTGRITCLSRASDGELLVAQGKQLFRQATAQARPRSLATFGREITSLVEVVPGEWWVGTRTQGLFGYLENDKPLFGELLNRVNACFDGQAPICTAQRDANGNVWIGSRGGGLVRASLRTGTVTKYSGAHQRGLTSRRILSIATDSRKQVWVATREGGLFLYQPESDSFRQFTTADGLPSNVVCALAEDEKGHLYVSTDDGLAVYLPYQPIHFRAFGVDDGIANTYFSFNASTVDHQGHVYFGNTNGLYVVAGLQLPRPQAAGVHISQVSVLQDARVAPDPNNALWQEAQRHQALTLSHQQNSFAVAWSALDFAAPASIRYAYRLRPYRTEWAVVSGEGRRAQFLDVPAGHYVLEIKYSDSYGRWGEAVTTLDVVVQPPFWLSRPLLALYLVLTLGAGWAAVTLGRRYHRLQRSLATELTNSSLRTQQMVYFSDLSHEIRNRLTLMLGPLEKALNGKKVNPGVLQNLYEQTIRLKRINDQLTQMRRSESGEFTLKVAETNLAGFVEKVLSEVEPLALIRDISLLNSTAANSTTAWFDDELLEIVLLNLLSNALKYTPEGGKVSVLAEEVFLSREELPTTAHPEGKYLRCTVVDTGIGIPEAEVRYLASPGYRASNTHQPAGTLSGTGQRLEVVGRLLKKHKGVFDVQSQEHAYTRVTFCVPIDKSHYEVSERKITVGSDPIVELQPVVPADSEEMVGTSVPYHILVVDDEPEVRQLLVDTFGTEALVTTASNGADALQLTQRHDFDAIISDLTMPELDGLGLLRAIKTNPQLNHLLFIVLTGQEAEARKLECLQSNADDFIEKPFSPDLLRWRVKNLIRSRQLLREKYSHQVRLGPQDEVITNEDEKFINRIVELIDTHLNTQELSVDFLAERCCISRATFYRRMESMVGESPSVFIRKYRLKKAALLLQQSDKYIAEVAYETGFNDPKYFSKCFAKEFGCSPAAYVKQLHSEATAKTDE